MSTKLTEKNNIENTDNTLKLGLFQLQTKSFWISLISILCIFLLSILYVNFYFYNKTIDRLLQHEEIILKHFSK
jgi:flagellar basal body-associated protein FliL